MAQAEIQSSQRIRHRARRLPPADRRARTIECGRQEGTFANVDPEDAARPIIGSGCMIARMTFSHRAPDKIERFLHSPVRIAAG